ncbi:rod-binding protein [uncultured Shimia sp.]|uniref:rod-binding protein n=1 Tax=uncultured Shimia sp. TaxID=573152 RepID=UPI0026361706|nr:rod-binding protein [uncultured Shimia sp.]
MPPLTSAPSTISQPTPPDARLREAAIELEATFLAEMLKYAGLGESSDGFGGGAGEDQFASFLRLEQAREMARSGGIGLAETLFMALKESTDG